MKRIILTTAIALLLPATGVAVGKDAYPITGTWHDHELRILRVDNLPCHPKDPEGFASDGVIILGDMESGTAFYVPPGVSSFTVNCEEREGV